MGVKKWREKNERVLRGANKGGGGGRESESESESNTCTIKNQNITYFSDTQIVRVCIIEYI